MDRIIAMDDRFNDVLVIDTFKNCIFFLVVFLSCINLSLPLLLRYETLFYGKVVDYCSVFRPNTALWRWKGKTTSAK